LKFYVIIHIHENRRSEIVRLDTVWQQTNCFLVH
jgi:hypothetical protein